MKMNDIHTASRLSSKLGDLHTQLNSISSLDVKQMHLGDVSIISGIRFKFVELDIECEPSESWLQTCRSILRSTEDLLLIRIKEVECELRDLGVELDPIGTGGPKDRSEVKEGP